MSGHDVLVGVCLVVAVAGLGYMTVVTFMVRRERKAHRDE